MKDENNNCKKKKTRRECVCEREKRKIKTADRRRVEQRRGGGRQFRVGGSRNTLIITPGSPEVGRGTWVGRGGGYTLRRERLRCGGAVRRRRRSTGR